MASISQDLRSLAETTERLLENFSENLTAVIKMTTVSVEKLPLLTIVLWIPYSADLKINY